MPMPLEPRSRRIINGLAGLIPTKKTADDLPEALSVRHAWLLMAPTGTGKTSLVGMLKEAIGRTPRHANRFRLIRASAPLLAQGRRVLETHQATTSSSTRVFPDKDGESVAEPFEEIVLEGPNGRVQIIASTGYDLIVEGAIDLDRLCRRVESLRRRLDLEPGAPLRLALLMNPLKALELAMPALQAYCHYWMKRQGLPFDIALDRSARDLWSSSLGELRSWNTGLELIPDEVLVDVSLKPVPRRRRIKPADRMLFEGPASANDRAFLSEAISRVAQTVARKDVDRRVMNDLLSLYPDSIVIATRADLIPFIEPTVTRGDVREVASTMFPGRVASRTTQVVVHGSYELEPSNNPLQPVYLSGFSSDADELLSALEAEQIWYERQAAATQEASARYVPDRQPVSSRPARGRFSGNSFSNNGSH